MYENQKLRIHTRLSPPERDAGGKSERAETEGSAPKRVRWQILPHPKARRNRFAEFKQKRAPGDRLLRDTAVACALLLTILALRNAELPWAKTAAMGVEKAITMKIDLDESLGRLYFVKNLVPEAALVFWNAGGSGRLRAPVAGEIEHAYEEERPWVIYSCAGGSPVTAALDGEVKAVEKGAGAEYIVVMTHDNGMESVYAYMDSVSVSAGDTLYAGDEVGFCVSGGAARLYFALRLDGNAADPMEYM